MNREKRRSSRSFALILLVLLTLLLAPAMTKEVQAAKAGFKTINGKTYYITSSGAKKKGWLTLNGKKYYFNTKTGVQLKGWQKDSKGKNIRYFTKGKGVMVTGFLKSGSVTRYFKPSTGKLVRGWLTLNGKKYYFTSGSGAMVKGWLKNSKGEKRYFKSNGVMLTGWFTDSKKNTRYFNPSTGYMYTGLKTIDGSIYYFSKSSGARYQKGFGTVGTKKYYFSPTDGKAQTGWLKLGDKSYYFNTSGVMYMNTTATIGGKVYTFDANGVATEKQSSNTGSNNSSSTVFTWYDAKHARNYTIMNQFKTHPGIADGSKSDLDILAAMCEAEAGDQGIPGMKAVALCILNRTLDSGFPSSVRYVVYEGNTKFAQYSVVTNGSLQKRLNGVFEDRTSAYTAAQQALDSFNAYVANGTPRTVSGMKTKDFKYKYFMMTSAFWNQSLNFKKVVYETYKDHTFFVDWV
ncbi:cell wall hydrolase [Blautia sp. HCP3S3_H10_1]|uniref:cell wall hydrolase n=1 Tax=unclassified Blautia TaxID=2648079 RepID=UPI003F91F9AE|nr:cell wall hydrolase [Clostridia bacterium]